MRFHKLDIEVTGPLEPVRVPDDAAGVALVLRWKGLPVGFAMRAVPSGSSLSVPALRELIEAEAFENAVHAALREELVAEPSHSPSLTVSVCTRDRTDLLHRCLSGMIRLRDAYTRGPVELMVVDNAPPDDRTAELVSRLKGVRYVTEPRAGLDFARNRALAECASEYLAFIDDDAVMDATWLPAFARLAAAHPDAGAFTGLVLPLELETEAQILFERAGGFGRGFRSIQYRGEKHAGNAYYPAGAGSFGAGCNMVFRRSALEALGGFDEALDTGAPLPGGGDIDMFYRVVRGGMALIYEPSLLVHHQHRRELDKLRRQYWSWGEGFMAFAQKSYRHDATAKPLFRSTVGWWFSYQLKQSVRSVLGRNPLPLRMILAEMLGGAYGLTGSYRRSLRRVHDIRRADEARQTVAPRPSPTQVAVVTGNDREEPRT